MDLTAAVRRAGTPLIFVAIDSTIVFSSEAADDLLGRPLSGLRLTGLVEPGVTPELLTALATNRAHRSVLTFDGRLILYAFAPSAAPGDGTQPRCVMLQDVTEELRRVAELEAANRRSDALLDAIPDLLFRISSDLTFLDYRDPTTKGLGLPPEHFLGLRLADFVPSEIVDLVGPNLKKALDTGAVVTYPSYYDYEDGRHTFDNRVVKSGPEEVVLICRDTTEQTRAQDEVRRSQARLHSIVHSSREYTTITDRDHLITFVSEPVERVLGYKPEELLGTDARTLIHPDDVAASGIARRLLDSESKGSGAPLRVRLRTKDGAWRRIEVTARDMFADELIGGLLTHCRDVTDYADVEQTLRDAFGRLDAIVETAADGFVTVNADGIIESINGAAQAMFQYVPLPGDDTPFEQLLHGRSREAFRRAVEHARVGDKEGLAVSVLEATEGTRPDGTTFPVSLAASFVTAQDGLVITVIVRDVSEQRALELQLEYQATHDVLTGLPNRSLFMAALDRATTLTNAATPSIGAVVFIDLDRFKVVNDSLGHAAGDQVITTVGARLTRATRGIGMVARFGGDEFLVLMQGCRDRPDVENHVTSILKVLEEPLEVSSEEMFVGASAGVATFKLGDPSVEPDGVVRNADIALYRAKAHGRARFEMYDPRLDRRSLGRLSTATELRRALARGEFVTYYQPVWGLKARQYVGSEALMRWHHDGAVVPPSRFITVAEETGAINELGEWILRDACRQTLAWQRELNLPGLTIAVNVSGCQLIHPEFVTVLTDVLAETGIAPETLALEITESTLIRDDDSTLERLHVLHATGVRISIDDFGTGYSSLSYLRQLPVDIIKIDRSFVSQIDDHPQTVEIVRAITTLAHSLNLVVIGEGIETVTQLHTLSSLDCDCAQGYLFARPGLPKATAAVLQHGFRPTDDIDPRSGRQAALSVARGRGVSR